MTDSGKARGTGSRVDDGCAGDGRTECTCGNEVRCELGREMPAIPPVAELIEVTLDPGESWECVPFLFGDRKASPHHEPASHRCGTTVRRTLPRSCSQ